MRTCTRCVMNDSSDSLITFDENGYCSYCTNQLEKVNSVYFPNEIGEKNLGELIEEIKENGRGKEYDCLMGISGGLDSSYLAYLGYKWGLRVYAVHIDDGFDTEISKNNIKKLVDKTGFEFDVITPNAVQFNALTKAYMKASVCNIAIPQDNVLFAYLYSIAKEKKIDYFLSGGNFALECILQEGYNFNSMDIVNIKNIHKKFGTEPIDKLKFMSSYKKYTYQKLFKFKNLRPLNYIDYNMEKAYLELNEFCGFEYYGGKHLENYFTAFAQLYWMPKKFNLDKATSHLSSMIVSGQMTREEAIEKLNKPRYSKEYMSMVIELVKRNLLISDKEFEEIMMTPGVKHEDYGIDSKAIFLRKFLK